MPCYTPEPTEREINAGGGLTGRQAKALLCGILTKHGQDILNDLDYEEIGVEHTLALVWWHKHEKQDEERRLREQAKKDQQRLADSAKAKLTPAEIEAIKKLS